MSFYSATKCPGVRPVTSASGSWRGPCGAKTAGWAWWHSPVQSATDKGKEVQPPETGSGSDLSRAKGAGQGG